MTTQPARWMGRVALWLCLCAPAFAQEPAPSGSAEAQAVSVKQIQLRVWITEISEQGLRDLGANLTYARYVRGVDQGGNLERVTTNLMDPANVDYRVTLPAPITDATSPQFRRATPPPSQTPMRPDLQTPLADGVQTQNGAGLTFDIIDSDHGTINGVFRAIERRSDLDLVSKPELLVRDKEQALIKAGGEFPFQDISYPNGRPTLNVAWKNLGVTMRVRALALSDNLVQIYLPQLDVSDIARVANIRGLDLPVLSTRSQTGMVVVPNNETIVIGGLTSNVVRRSEQRIPIVGAVPIVGIPFRSRRSEPIKSQLYVLISPTIIDLRDLKPEAESALNFWEGKDWRHSDSFKQEIKIMQEAM